MIVNQESEVANILKFLRETILELTDLDESDIQLATPLDELEMDSLDYVEVQIETKKEFGVKINPNVFSSGEVQTVGDFCHKIMALRECELDAA